MKALIDTHTHTVASGHHTTDTIVKLAEKASEKGLVYLCVTDHAPAMPGAAKASYFMNLKYCERERYGVKLLYGAELNVLGADGSVDLDDEITDTLDFCIASLHKDVFRPATEAENTSALVNAMKNRHVCIIGHPDNPDFSLNVSALTDAAAENGVMLELNSVGTDEKGYRKNNFGFLREMLSLCKRKGVYVSLGSDSHGAEKIADFKKSELFMKEAGFPTELVVNYDPALFLRIVEKRRLSK